MSSETTPNLLLLIGRQIKRFRREADMSQQELAEKTGFFRTYISRIEGGIANPSIMVLATIARELNVEIQHLLVDSEE